MNEPRREKGCTRNQVGYLRDLRQCDKELARIGVLTFFLTTRLGIEDTRSMMWSAVKQRKLIAAVCIDLKKYRVDPEYDNIFKWDIQGLKRRCDYVFKVCKEDLRLTEHYPYFEAVGFEQLMDIPLEFRDKTETPLDKILPDMEMWENNHKTEIASHMESVKEEIRIRDEHREKVRETAKAEKEAEKDKKKAERDEIKEIKKNNEAYRKRQRKIEKEFERYY